MSAPLLILVVDDNEMNRYLTGFLLRQAGAEVVEARDAHEAVARCAERPPALVIMDLSLPGMDGYAVAARLRAQPGCEHLPMVVATASAQPSERARALASGFAAYFEKPLDVTTFAAEALRYVQPKG